MDRFRLILSGLGLLCLFAACAPGAYASSPPFLSPSTTATATQSDPTRTPYLPLLQMIVPASTQTSAPTLAQTRLPVEDQIIGHSLNGRPIEVKRFGTGAIAVMIVAGIHGGYEHNTVQLADALIAKLRTDPELVPANRTLYILRVLNPDGLARAADTTGRANANNVDLNRNWDAFWEIDLAKRGCFPLAPLNAGERPMSEPETQALADFMIRGEVKALISYHSAGAMIYAGGEPADPSTAQPGNPRSRSLAEALAKVSPYAYPPEQSCVYTGQLIDWAAQHGIAAVDVELRNHTDTDLTINLKVLQAFLEW